MRRKKNKLLAINNKESRGEVRRELETKKEKETKKH